MKTAREWFKQLPEGIREEAIELAVEDGTIDKEYESLQDVIWEFRRGDDYHKWNVIYAAAVVGQYDLPTIPPPIYQVLKCVPVQLCPKCDGEGNIRVVGEYDFTIMTTTCHICKGAGVIPMHVIE